MNNIILGSLKEVSICWGSKLYKCHLKIKNFITENFKFKSSTIIVMIKNCSLLYKQLEWVSARGAILKRYKMLLTHLDQGKVNACLLLEII